MKLIVGNPVALDAFRAGIPGNGKPFPDGSKMAKVEWRPKKSAHAPYDINVPGTVTQYPNWRQRWPVMLETLAGDQRLRRVAEVLAEAGRSAANKR